jgi:transcriptional regulator with XRE-family HTH domain|uniref:helix-turn-helix domain-containing protein n=1 Tax=unclassified Microcoleus TaxID=2642155 RepID=UPI001D65533A|nr:MULTISPECIES: helix-turn-helix transcriptional regulator [unclassified Microcoleus]MCC3504378.1 helix-turn-helix transcriptional regulator [Microcoleus sp. PH2017_19_SFW_U_A]TAG87637.1 MAG: XRE family transcriptional regulator [Oscillatoriales cyanobacterium]MCC3524741.1 helix-turn-helix transcriptional regulator [Microcoleus sp. PH2017_20_SFW_D_A]MCC3555657.1 helix-turn-helix transcriptional regulator [Microcoleus sp. PH2017_35_SFW_U_B]MCC3569295.1 helix-turn-helix transcriptional regulato
MIGNELQYEYSKEWVEKFNKTLAAMERDEEAKRKDFLKWDAGRGSIQCHLDQLHEEIAEYERLMAWDKSEPIEIVVENFNKLSEALIKARMAAKMSEEELAEILDIDPERIKEYEKKKYQNASLTEILDISLALGLEFKTAVMQVDFEEIEAIKETAERWRKRKREKASKMA